MIRLAAGRVRRLGFAPPLEEKWTFRHHAASGRLFLVGEGFATEKKSREAAREFIELLGSSAVDLVVDVGRVTGYESGARRAWQECFYPVRRQLRRILVVGPNVPGMVRMAASVVAAVIGVPISFHATLDEFDDAVARGKPA